MGNASDLLDQILTHGPSQNTIFIALSKMKEEGLHSKIIQECLKALSVYPDDIRIRHLLAESYLETGFISLAEEELLKVASEIEKLTPAYMLQTRIYKRQNKPEKAIESLKIYLALNPDDQEAIDLYEEIAPTETATPLEVSEPDQLEDEPVEESIEEEQETEPPEEDLEVEAEVEAEVDAEEELEIEAELKAELEAEIETEVETVEPATEEEPIEEIAEPEPEEKELPEEETSEIIEDEAEVSGIEEEEEIVDIATPTLAELYFNQGQIQEAIETYEKVLLNDPADETSEQRLNELKTSLNTEAEPQLPEDDGGDLFQEKTEKSIAILEGWLAQLQKKN